MASDWNPAWFYRTPILLAAWFLLIEGLTSAVNKPKEATLAQSASSWLRMLTMIILGLILVYFTFQTSTSTSSS